MVFIADNVSWIICYYVGLWINMIMYEKGLWKKGIDRKGLILHHYICIQIISICFQWLFNFSLFDRFNLESQQTLRFFKIISFRTV